MLLQFLFSLFSTGDGESLLYIVFALIIIIFMVLDLGVLNKTAHKITTKSALYQSIFWVLVSMIFGFFIYQGGPYEIFEDGERIVTDGADAAILYFSAYLTEYALSVDNIFVILLILKYF